MTIQEQRPEINEWEVSVIDVETDDLVYTKLYCLVVRCTKTLNTKKFVSRKEAIKAGVPWQADWLGLEEFPSWAKANVKTYIAHNGICFDMCVLADLLDFPIPIEQTYDTLVVSRLLQPQREDGHSLDAWGVRVGCRKIKFEDFSKLSLEMVDYCDQDTLVNVKVYHWLQDEKAKWGFSNVSVWLEHMVRVHIFAQEKHGFFLDRAKATKLLSDTATRLRQVESDMFKVFVPQPRLEKVMVQKTKKDGSLSSVGAKKVINAIKNSGLDPDQVLNGQPVAYMVLEDFNLGSPKQVAERLLEIGWKPKNLTPTGQPKIDEESLAPFAEEFPQVALLSEYLMVRSRNSIASQWLEAVDKRGYVHGRVNTMGAITGRMTHSDPNMANVPKAMDSVPYGKECRGCWTVEDPINYRLVGCDASSLELRMLCHYMNDDKYTEAAISGDIHALNMWAFGLVPLAYASVDEFKVQDPKGFKDARNMSKTLLYAILYGAGDAKVGRIRGVGGAKMGKQTKQNLFTGIPKFGALIEWVSKQALEGYVYGLDGRRIWTRSQHAALNTLLQGGGAIVCKLWMCYIHKLAKEQGLRYAQLCQIHDEYQFQCHKDDVEAFGQVTKDAMKEVEKFLKMKCPLDSEWKAGLNWAETH